MTTSDHSYFTPFGQFLAAEARDDNLLGQRLSEARRLLGFNQQQLCNRLSSCGIDVKVAAVSKWEKGETVPNAYQLIALCSVLKIRNGLSFFTGDIPDTDGELNAEGLRKVRDYREDLIASGRYRITAGVSEVRFREMPVSLYSASAGIGQFLDSDNFETLSFPETSIPSGADFGVRVSGNSMEPHFHDGQIVWVEKRSRVLSGEIGLFVLDGESYIKLYQEQMPDDTVKDEFIDSTGTIHPQPVLVSYNKEYAPRPVSPGSSFQTIGRILTTL